VRTIHCDILSAVLLAVGDVHIELNVQFSLLLVVVLLVLSSSEWLPAV